VNVYEVSTARSTLPCTMYTVSSRWPWLWHRFADQPIQW